MGSLKLYDLILSFLVLSRTNFASKTFLRSLWKVLILCDFLNLGCFSNHKPQCFDFLIECKLNEGTCHFFFYIIKILHFDKKLAFKQVVRFLSPS